MKRNQDEFEVFISKMEGAVKAYYGESHDVAVKEVVKLNGLILHGLTILKTGRNICPTIYLEDYYERYRDGYSFSEVFKMIIETYEKHNATEFASLDYFTDYSAVADNLYIKMINAKLNKNLLEDVPHRIIEDLALVCYVEVTSADNSYGTVLIHNNHICMWGVKEDRLFEDAIANSVKVKRVCFKKLGDVILQISCEEDANNCAINESCNSNIESTGLGSSGDHENLLEDDDLSISGDPDSMYVLTNNLGMFGAAVLAYPNLLQKLSDVLMDNFYIIPSSIHELIILPSQITGNLSSINEMIRSVNSEILSPQEVLSNHAYFYNIQSKQLSSVTDEMVMG